MPKTHKISEVKTRDNFVDIGHEGDGGGNLRGGRGGDSCTGRGGDGNNHGKKPVVRRLMTVPTSSTSTFQKHCTSITLRTINKIFMSCAWLNWRKKDLRATGISMSVILITCSVSLMNPEWGMMTHPMTRPTYMIFPALILKGTGWTLKITRIMSVRVVLVKGTRSRNEKMRRPTMNILEKPHITVWLQWLLYILYSSGNRYLRLQPVLLHI